jgi:hypothetical protein
MMNRAMQIDHEDRLQLRANWEKGFKIDFDPTNKLEGIERDDFYNANWLNLSSKQEGDILSSPFQINGVWRRPTLVGWQRLKSGLAVLHREKVQEDMNLASGHLIMAKVKPDRTCEVIEEYSSIPADELKNINFMLAVAEHPVTGMEAALLFVIANFTVAMPQLSISEGEQHSTMSPEESWYLVLKSEIIGK